MFIKLDLEIELSQKFVFEHNSEIYYKHVLGVKINSFDTRFKPYSCIQEHQLFIARNQFRLLSTLQLPEGKMDNHALVLPLPELLGNYIYYEFIDDVERRIYLKRLYDCIIEWSNNWWGFKGDNTSRMYVNDNRWVLGCDTVKEEKLPLFTNHWLDMEEENHNHFLIT